MPSLQQATARALFGRDRCSWKTSDLVAGFVSERYGDSVEGQTNDATSGSEQLMGFRLASTRPCMTAMLGGNRFVLVRVTS
jgi:hypothetical protein